MSKALGLSPGTVGLLCWKMAVWCAFHVEGSGRAVQGLLPFYRQAENQTLFFVRVLCFLSYNTA